MKFINAFSFFMASFFSMFLLFVPVLHLYENEANVTNVFALQLGVDSLSMIIGLLGFFTVMALVQVHKRLSAIEKAIL